MSLTQNQITYAQKRLTEVYNEKITPLKNKKATPLRAVTMAEAVQAILDGVKLIPLDNYRPETAGAAWSSYVDWNKTLKRIPEKPVDNTDKIAKIKAEYTRLMDQIMLGEEQGELLALLAAFTKFGEDK